MSFRLPTSPATSDACSIVRVDPSLSVNETLRRWPSTIAVLDAYGIDTCCCGAASLADAASEAGVPSAALLDAITRAVSEGA